MPGIGEAGEAIEDVFAGQADTLEGLIDATTRHVHGMQTLFESAVVGSGNDHVGELRGQLSEIVRSLGAAAAMIPVSRATSQELLADWGIGPAAASTSQAEIVGVQNDRVIETPKTADLRTWLDDPNQLRLGADISSILTYNNTPLARRAVMAAKREKVDSVRDVLVIGADNLKDIPQMGPKCLEVLRNSLSHYFPGLLLPDNADPVIAARMCPSLNDVPLQALDGHDMIVRRRDVRLTVQDILDRPAAEMFVHRNGHRMIELTEWDLSKFNDLRQKAIAYAEQFNLAKRALGLTQP
ncbi:MAG TPA: hypothetical protein VMR45_05255 [Patescibacteria group bacterium]|nr:hypothetical protein [Patescibacteria group bacterium]